MSTGHSLNTATEGVGKGIAILDVVATKGHSEITFGSTLVGGKEPDMLCGESIPGRENSECQALNSACSQNRRQEAGMAKVWGGKEQRGTENG